MSYLNFLHGFQSRGLWKRMLLAVTLKKLQHFFWKVQHAFVIVKYLLYTACYSRFKCTHQKFIPKHFTTIGWRGRSTGLARPRSPWSLVTLDTQILTSWKLTSAPGSPASRHPLMVRGWPRCWPRWPHSACQCLVTARLTSRPHPRTGPSSLSLDSHRNVTG